MEVITIEHKAYQQLIGSIEQISETLSAIKAENDLLKADRYLTMKEIIEYTGHGVRWIETRREAIGYYQDGKEITMKKSDIDRYLAKHFVKRRLSKSA